ncbi:hypothetical protein AVEN_130289-1 [Araneus ventricosus]|uniref:Uncharacterized protein n=1 Tax=Araneus ventricosus TaxID=182803 RepID=A0A4Y2LAD9_ARAVE|nr:hypothetical protein AVEN_137337-1 [Araneus ventricosus]GBN11661.1 hypothetical protein AVEN_130289-1 [Araneus ventricosus]
MYCRLPTSLVSCLGREFYTDKCGMAGPGPLTLATNSATILRQIDDSRKCYPFLDISFRKENTRDCTRKLHVSHSLSGRVYKGRSWIREYVLIDWNDFGVSSTVRARKLVMLLLLLLVIC